MVSHAPEGQPQSGGGLSRQILTEGLSSKEGNGKRGGSPSHHPPPRAASEGASVYRRDKQKRDESMLLEAGRG